MGTSKGVDGVIKKIKIMRDRIKWKVEARNKYKNLNGNLAVKKPCSHCMGMAEEINIGDDIIVVKRNPKKFCTDPWHEILGQVQEIDNQGKKMTIIGYSNSTTGFNFTKYCSDCWRIICVKQF